MVSISDVAKRAGVSPTTVSHTLSGKRVVSEEVRRRVTDAMRELGYVPSRAAQNLAHGRSRLIALVVPDIANGFFAELARGVEQTAIDASYNVVLCTTGFDHAREVFYLEMIRSRAVDGIVYAAGAPPTTSQLSALLGDLPLVLVDEEVPGSAAPAIVSDNHEGGRLAARHLFDLGHREAVALVAAGELASSRKRWDGFREVWEAETGSTPAVATGGFTAEGGASAVEQVLDRLVDGPATAVFAVNDLMALGAIERMERAGLSVPADVSVVGFDDTPAARYARPKLTTIRQDVAGLGRRACTTLVTALQAPSDEPQPHGQVMPVEQVLPVELVVRESTSERVHP